MHAPHVLDDLQIERIAAGLVDCSLPATEWTHAAHFAAALWLLRHRPGFNAAAMAPVIQRYNLACGNRNTDTSGYHETITRASLAAAAAALAAQPHAALPMVLDRLLAGPCGRSDWLLAHWRHETLFTPEARRHWVPPDLDRMPFPL
ncbi:hypothetical protein [Polymorphobacter multimanifer]|uniref:Uncharacterized protein n=1 Tax=Polymorphobacter multimanifer TaxID=1070431 RepID=A0A841LBX9_9SPHN|nr:hypothetical protein [Polymorphobacter multimanifer]MBB6228483.1 hypothetical protein [Polymorphobacter multimanifer]